MGTYALMSLCNSAIIYGTKMGVELTSVGLPVIVAGEAWIRNKGITLDATTPDEYFRLLSQLPFAERLSPPQLSRARRYAYHFFFNRMIPLPFIEPKAAYPIYRLKLERLQQLLPGASQGLDTICDGILAHGPFVLRDKGSRAPAIIAAANRPRFSDYSFLAFLISMLACVALCALVRRTAPAIGAVVPPRADRWHSEPTPTMGGVAIAVGTVLGFGVIVGQAHAMIPPAAWLPIPLAAIAMFVVGVLDDRFQLSPLAKLVASLIIGAFLVFSLTRSPGTALPWTHTLVATIWFAGVCHAFNLLDNMDGLAAGVALIAAGFMAWLLAQWLGSPVALLLVALCGALLGFLYWNRPPARLFMGDCGSLFIGAVLAGASLMPVLQERTVFPWTSVLVVLILVVPLFDTGFVLVLRRFAGRSATRGGTDHVSHRLVSLGFSERSAVRILYLLGIIGGCVAWALVNGGIEQMFPLAALLAVVVTLIGIYLARVPAYNAQDFAALESSSFAPLLKDLTFRWHAGEVMLDLVLIAACYYFAYRLRFEGESLDQFLPYFTASLPVVLGCKLASLYGSGLYQRSWETFGLRDVSVVLRGVLMGSLLSVLAAVYFYRLEGFRARRSCSMPSR